MANDSVTRCLGLVTQYNPHQVAPGALIKADNCVVDRENIIEDRRGYSDHVTLVNDITALGVYNDTVFGLNGSVLSYDNGSATGASVTGSYSPPTGRKMRFLEAFNNCYITTHAGVKALTDTAGTAAISTGVPRSLDITLTLGASGTGFMATAKQVAYRSLIRRTDANGNVKFGYPSTRAWVTNESGSNQNVTVKAYIPSEVTTSDLVQVYRTECVTYSGANGDEAGDEMALVYQVAPTSTDVSNGYVQFTDTLIDALRGATLYTSPSQEGIAQGNERPPLAEDIALYKSNWMMYANTQTKHRLSFNLVGTSGLTGSTITLAGVTYNFGATEVTSGGGAPQAKVFATGVVAVDIAETAKSLVRVINLYASNTTVYAFYVSQADGLPGQIMVEERTIGGSAFTIQSSAAGIQTMFSPQPPVSPSTSSDSTSANQANVNGLYFAKYQQPEAVPSLNYALVGSANKEILRIAPLRNSLIIIKEEGVYTLTGDSPPFDIAPLDLTVFCKSADSVSVLANTVIMLSNQGVVQITESGVQVISREIEPNIKPLLGFSGISNLAVAGSYESDRAYLLSLPSNSTDTEQNQIYRYNIFTKTWTRWTFGASCFAVVPSEDVLYFAKPSSEIIQRERKSFTDDDYADPEYSVTINSVDQTNDTIQLATGAITPTEGLVIEQSDISIPIIAVAAGPGYYTCTMDNSIPDEWAAGAATAFPSVGMEFIWDAWTGQGGAGMLKQVSELAILADNISGNNPSSGLTPTFTSNFDEERDEVSIQQSSGGWDSYWGSIPWGGANDSYGYRTYVPRNKQICRILNPGVKHPFALERLSCAGFALQFEPISARITK